MRLRAPKLWTYIPIEYAILMSTTRFKTRKTKQIQILTVIRARRMKCFFSRSFHSQFGYHYCIISFLIFCTITLFKSFKQFVCLFVFFLTWGNHGHPRPRRRLRVSDSYRLELPRCAYPARLGKSSGELSRTHHCALPHA